MHNCKNCNYMDRLNKKCIKVCKFRKNGNVCTLYYTKCPINDGDIIDPLDGTGDGKKPIEL